MSAHELKAELDDLFRLTTKEIAFYHQQGFIKLRNVLSKNLLNHYGQEVTAQVQRLNELKKPISGIGK